MGQHERELDAVFAALSHPTRRAIVRRLATGETSVSELARPLEVTLTTVGKHLRALDEAGLIVHEKRGRVRRCRLRAEPLRAVQVWIADYAGFWEQQLDSLAAHVGGPADD